MNLFNFKKKVMSNNELKEELDQVVNLAAKAIDQSLNLRKNEELKQTLSSVFSSIEDTKRVILADITYFLLYLAASDGEVVEEEARLISEIYGIQDFSPDDAGFLIRQNNIYSVEYETERPYGLMLLIGAENDGVCPYKKSLSERLINLYKQLGTMLIESDNKTKRQEKADYNNYIRMLEEYRAKEYKGIIGGAKGFTKK